MALNIAYLAQGKLFLKSANQAVHEIESEFGKSVQDRRLQIQRRQAMFDRTMPSMMQPPGINQSAQQQPEATIPVDITSVCRIDSDQLLYSLESAALGGLFSYDPSSETEQRLFHNTDFHIGHLSYSAKHHLLACTKAYPTGIANLATLSLDYHRPQDLTEGDSIDSAPCWVKGKEKAIVYQSAGVRRNSQGFVIERAPVEIMELDFETQSVSTLAEASEFDLLGPRRTADGWLYYIRRPYQSFGRGFSLKRLLKDLVMLPFRLAHAIFQFFNMFSQMMTGQPLIDAVTREKVERQPIRTLGGMFLPENLPKRHVGENDAPALVPASWQLVRQDASGVPEVIAKNVLSYDVADDGSLIYTNGSGIYAIPATQDGTLDISATHQRILVGQYIESVIALPQQE